MSQLFDVSEQVERPVLAAASHPELQEIIAEFSPLPKEAAFLGVAEDGLPVLLNLLDPVPGPLLICGDSNSGKTRLLKNIATATDLIHSPAEVSYIVITQKIGEWDAGSETGNLLAVQNTNEPATLDLLRSLADWAHNNKGEQQSILLMIDDLSALIRSDSQVAQHLRWLLLRGPSRRVWPIVTLNPDQAGTLSDWLDFFRTRLFGRMEKETTRSTLGAGPQGLLRTSADRAQFMMKEGSHWLGFWVPEIGSN